MSKQQRNLVIYQAQKFDTELYVELAAHNWQVHVANDLQTLADLSDQHLFRVGLYFVSEKCSNNECLVGRKCLIDNCTTTRQLSQINRLFNRQGEKSIHWIMCLPSACMTGSSKSNLMVDYDVNQMTCPIDTGRLLCVLNNSYGLDQPALSLEKKSTYYPASFGIIGNSSVMQDLFNRLDKVAKEDCSVLIEGETGTGKELVATAIHSHSGRAKYPLVAINCGAFPKDLIQAELFGHEKGAFTGALQRKIGRIEMAQGGTLFLDEIGDLPLEQ